MSYNDVDENIGRVVLITQSALLASESFTPNAARGADVGAFMLEIKKTLDSMKDSDN